MCAALALSLAGCTLPAQHASPISVADSRTTAGTLPGPRRLSSAEEEWVIARAIAEHEMRRP